MSKDKKPIDPTRLLKELQKNEELKHQLAARTELGPQLALLRAWQSRRLAVTYTDLLADPQFNLACNFFLSDVYAPRDFTQRDYDIQRIHSFLSHILPPQTLVLLTASIELITLTATLDNQLSEILFGKLGVTDEITPGLYAEAYRVCDNYPERLHQIQLSRNVLQQVGEGAHMTIVGITMKLAKKPAQSAGWVELYDFLERGYSAFKHMRDIHTFVNTIEQRETTILNRIFSSESDPFNL
jgi:hypothetical protein